MNIDANRGEARDIAIAQTDRVHEVFIFAQ